MSIEEIEIRQKKLGCGFVKPTETTLAGVKFPNGKIAYLAGGDVQVAYDETLLVSTLKQEPGCFEVQVVHKHKA